MSHALEAPPLENEPIDAPARPLDRDLQDFSYRPMPILAFVGLGLGVLSAFSLLGLVGLVISVLGIVTALAATLRIALDRENFSGLKLAVSGLVLSTAFFAAGLYNQIDLYRRELPPGFQRISFRNDISAHRFDIRNGQYEIPPDVAGLEGQPIFFKAWMFPIEQTRGLTTFLVVKDNGLCCFGKQPDPWDSIIVALDPQTFPEGVDHTTSMVSIAGTLEVLRDENGQLSTLYQNVTPYRVEAAYFVKSWTMF